MDSNPEEALKALVEPAPLTLGQVAVLELMGSPLLRGDASDLAKTAAALWILSLPSREAAARWREADVEGIAWLDEVGVAGYRSALGRALDAVAAFWRLVPRPDEDQKKE